ncbi:MAG TPA: cytochrome c, partial [Aestuariivirga sp.]|nr:cytochrome c [Aestuariivirga sp.]
FFLIIFVGLTAHSHGYIASKSTNPEPLPPAVVAGKRIWEEKGCINCHTILGEGAYFAPELSNVMTRWGIAPGDHQAAKDALSGWMNSMPSGTVGRRQMPHFILDDTEFQNLADFLLWVDTIDAQGWPPNNAG